MFDLLTIENLEKWQTLMAGGFAAIVSALFVVWQSNSSRRLEKKRRLAKFDSLRSTLSLLLNGMLAWNDENIRLLKTMYPNNNSRSIPIANREQDWPIFPPEFVKQLQDTIEFCDDSDLRNILGQILSKIQISIARLNSMKPSNDRSLIVSAMDLDSRIYDQIDIHVWIESLYDYARREARKPPTYIDTARYERVIFVKSLDTQNYPSLLTRIQSQVDKKIIPISHYRRLLSSCRRLLSYCKSKISRN